MLGGQVSAETRQVLMSGENPMLEKKTATDVNGMAIIDSTPPGQMRQDFPRGRGAQPPGFGRQVNLQGLPQVIGLALGAPEFQRR
jgi:hypothetical protein